MRDFTQTYQATIESSLAPDAAGAAVASFILRLGSEKLSGDGLAGGEERIGSRAAYRLWGASRWLPGWKKMPIIISWKTQPTGEGGSSVELQMTSDLGPRYLLMTSTGAHGFEVRFRELEADLREVLR